MDTTGLLASSNIEGRPLDKLIEVVSSGTGTLYCPRNNRREVEAQTYVTRLLEKAKIEAESESMIVEAGTFERIGQRMVANEYRRQENIDTVVEQAAQILAGVEVSDKPVDKDWATRFFGIVQDVSNEEMKILWAKILAKEIERPSSYSLRTLDVLRNISYEEAKLFTRLSNLVFLQDEYCFVYKDENVLRKNNLGYWSIAKLKEAGLLQEGETAARSFTSGNYGICTHEFVCGNSYFILTTQPNTGDIVLPVYLLTQAGYELYDLAEHKDNKDYIKDFATFIKKSNPSASLQYGKVLERRGTQTRYELPLRSL